MEVFTLQQVADLLGKTRNQITYAMRQEQIPQPAMHVQHYRLFTEDQVAEIRKYFETRKPTWRDSMSSLTGKEDNVL
jgi:hypothetical protein